MAWKLIDVSEHQGTMNWDAVAPHIDGAIIRCGYGNDERGQDDAQFERNVAECRRLGIPFGVYLYSYAENDAMAESEAAHMLRKIEEVGGGLSLPAYLDVEQRGLEWYFKRACEVVGPKVEAAGYWMGWYSGRANANAQGLASLPYTAWVAEYGAPLAFDGAADIWQYTSSEYVGGVGPLDCNECYRDLPGEITGTGFAGDHHGDASQPQPTPDGDLPAMRLRAQTEDGTVLPWTEHPDYAGWDDNGAITYLCVDCEWPVDVQAHTQASGWLPWLTNPADVDDKANGCVGDGSPITGIKMYVHAPNADKVVEYRTHQAGRWYSYQRDTETSDGQDGYAGDLATPITRVEACLAAY